MQLMSVVRRGIIEPLYSKWSGSPKRRIWKELERTQYESIEELREKQWEKLLKLIKFVEHNNPYYKKLFQQYGVSGKAIQSPEDLSLLPVLTKQIIRETGAGMLSKDFSESGLLHFKTGGSTGRALDIFITEECSEWRNACACRHNRWSGWEVGEPVAAVWGNPVFPSTMKKKIRSWLLDPVMYLDTMRVDHEAIREFYKNWKKIRPTLIFGHAHSIYLLATMLRELGIQDIRPKGIISSSMMLVPHERIVIEDVFDVKVTDRYGCEELGLIGCECEQHKGMHLNIDHLYIEFLRDDGMPAAPGEEGRIIITDLINHAMPLVRYQVEDVGVLANHNCPCGRGLPLMARVTGRIADFLVRHDGSKVAGISLIENTLTHFAGLDQMQIIQHSLDKFEINIVPGRGFEDCVLEGLRKYFISEFGNDTSFDFCCVQSIHPEKNGKYRFSICNLN